MENIVSTHYLQGIGHVSTLGKATCFDCLGIAKWSPNTGPWCSRKSKQGLPATYLIPGSVGRRVGLGSENLSGGAAGAGVWKAGSLEIWKLGNLGTWKSENLEIYKLESKK